MPFTQCPLRQTRSCSPPTAAPRDAPHPHPKALWSPPAPPGTGETRFGASVCKPKALGVVWPKHVGIRMITTGADTPPPKKTQDRRTHTSSFTHTSSRTHLRTGRRLRARACVLAHMHTASRTHFLMHRCSLACTHTHAHSSLARLFACVCARPRSRARVRTHRRALMALGALLPGSSGPAQGCGSETSGNLTLTPRERHSVPRKSSFKVIPEISAHTAPENGSSPMSPPLQWQKATEGLL